MSLKYEPSSEPLHISKVAVCSRQEHPFYNLICNDGKTRLGSQLTHDVPYSSSLLLSSLELRDAKVYEP